MVAAAGTRPAARHVDATESHCAGPPEKPMLGVVTGSTSPSPSREKSMSTALDFASFDINELGVLDATDAVALPDMGASVIIVVPNSPDGDEILTEDSLNASGSLSTSSSCC
jgi:hypothetical protein